MTRTERLLDILQFLRGRRAPVVAADLAERFKVSERTIYRDIGTLIGQGAAIEGAAGLGYLLRDDFFLPPLTFDTEEAAAILLGLRFVAMRGDGSLGAAAASAKAKLSSVVPEQFSPNASNLSALVAGPSSGQPMHILATVREAVMRERKLAIQYADQERNFSRRTVWPVLLGWFDSTEMMAAWCEMRGSFRHFRIDRITDCQLIDERPTISRNRLLADYQILEPGVAL